MTHLWLNLKMQNTIENQFPFYSLKSMLYQGYSPDFATIKHSGAI